MHPFWSLIFCIANDLCHEGNANWPASAAPSLLALPSPFFYVLYFSSGLFPFNVMLLFKQIYRLKQILAAAPALSMKSKLVMLRA
ncbi:hypothetical protein DJ535_20215 [Citrobacter murliniae]|uniref:Uncharacterized protein n=1 Tax=Citrobacter murliniae TaxID=67829 RepID=A0ABY2PPX0_9ENTR|nr:hypothetical protein DJ535_20215 [Citrobacter murliniae]